MSEKHRAFGETTKKDWALAAGKELGDDNPFEKLSHKRGDLTLLPYYDASDLPSGTSSRAVQHGKQWVNAPRVVVDDARTANTAALEHLQAGANGVFFEISNSSADPAHLFSGIELPFCSVFFYGNVTAQFLESFSTYVKSHFDPKDIRGAAYGLSLQAFTQCHPTFKDFYQFKTLGVTITTEALECHSLTTLLREMEAHQRHDSELNPAAVLVSLSDDFFGEIIRIRAIDLLWSCYCAAYGQTAELLIHCMSRPLSDPSFEPHGNMIASTSRAVSAVIAGAHALTIDPETQGSHGERIARNISFIADEEAHLARSGNPVMGSYFIESSARQLAEKAWSQFQAIMRS
jgi:methylmalonyl-CoA mutase